MKFSVKYCVIALFMALFCVDAYADGGTNTGFSPYSKFGIGRLARKGTAQSQAMGGVGIASRNTRYINTLNPAAVTARDTLAFMADISLTQENAYYRQGDLKSVDNTFNINSFVMSFPIWKSSAFMVGINPFSGLGYNFTSPVTDQSVIGHTGKVNDIYQGNGSLYELYVGAGVTFWKRLSVGAQMNYIFGQLQKLSEREFSSSSISSVYDESNMTIRGINGKFGLQYEQPIKGDRLTVGATYRIKSKLWGSAEKLRYSIQGNYVDTLGLVNDISLDKVNIPQEVSVGLSYKHSDTWMMEFDYTWSDWKKAGMDQPGFNSEGFTGTVSQSFNFGFEYTPNRNDIRYYMRRVTYRGGFYYSTDYYTYKGYSVPTMALSLGLTLPVFRWSNGLSLGMELGQKGLNRDGLIRERFINFSIGFNIYDIWFMKHKYD